MLPVFFLRTDVSLSTLAPLLLRIRLQRTGCTNTPSYRIVVAEHSAPVKGGCLEILGHYLPSRDPVVLQYKEERFRHWIQSGAKPSDTLARLLTKSGVKGLEMYIEAYTKKRKKKEEVKEASETPVATPGG